MVENLKIEGIKDYPIKWICNFRGQKAIGICGYSQKIAMFAADSRVSKILEDIVIGTKEELEGYGCEEKKTDAATLNVNFVKLIQDNTCKLLAKNLQIKTLKN